MGATARKGSSAEAAGAGSTPCSLAVNRVFLLEGVLLLKPPVNWFRMSTAILACSLLVMAIVAPCAIIAADTAPAARPLAIVDQTGVAIKLERAPERIVSLAPSNTEILFSLGLGSKIVGVTTACDFPAEAKAIDKVGDYNINIEAVVAKHPDLIVAVADLQMAVIEKLRQLKLNVVAVNPSTVEEVFSAIQLIGDVAGRSDAAKARVSELRARMAAVEKRAAGIPASQRPAVFVEIWNDPLMTCGKGTFVNDLVSGAGGRNIFGAVDGWPQISSESVIAARPNVIILTAYNRSEVMGRREWRQVPAIVREQVYEIVPDLLVRPGPRLIDGLEALADIFSKAK